MRVVVTGSRTHTDATMRQALMDALAFISAPPGKELTIIHGAAKGADTVAEDVAAEWGANVYRYPVEYGMYPKKAAPLMRNAEMAKLKPDYILAFPNDTSKGTWHMINMGHKNEITVIVDTTPLTQAAPRDR